MKMRPIWIFAIVATALAGCSDPPAASVDADLDTYNSTARLAFDQGQIQQAERAYTRALNRARQMDDPTEIAAAAYNLAIVKATLADYTGAMELLDEADYASTRSNAGHVDIILARAQIDLMMKVPAEAASCADAVLRTSSATSLQQLQAHVSRGLAACQMENGSEASTQLEAARKLSAAITSPAAGAMVAGLGGEVHLLEKDSIAAAMDFDRQASLNQKAHNYGAMDRALIMAGHAYAAGDKQNLAADRLYRAARAAIARGDANTITLSEEASAAATKSGDTAMIKLTKSLLKAAIASTQPAE